MTSGLPASNGGRRVPTSLLFFAVRQFFAHEELVFIDEVLPDLDALAVFPAELDCRKQPFREEEAATLERLEHPAAAVAT